jgi:hypothetical protein
MDIDSPQYTERPVRLFDAILVGGGRDSVMLEPTDTIAFDTLGVRITVKDEVIWYNLSHLIGYRLRKTVVRTKTAPPKV